MRQLRNNLLVLAMLAAVAAAASPAIASVPKVVFADEFGFAL